MQVLAKTSVANVHEVNGHLGVVLNSLDNMKYWKSVGETEQYESQKKAYDGALTRIWNEVGVHKPVGILKIGD
jgi:hypothetical protein